ncbi:helix-turn-helix domain-containing protein [Photobacterium leiognathi]|uniref:helix-turn-helix domain-containing protein n=1 Tax=Photobacterium leiognathi TaxID=553611 RepID=UPI002739FE73|nr:helix-turn-helix transcriptional regulator [Photobacterium leiognathi]
MAYSKEQLDAIAHNVKKYRTEKVLSQEEFANNIGVSVKTLSRIETAKGCGSSTLNKMSKYLDVAPASLFKLKIEDKKLVRKAHDEQDFSVQPNLFLSIISYELDSNEHFQVIEKLRNACEGTIPTSNGFALSTSHIRTGIKGKSPAGFLLVGDRPLTEPSILALKEYASTNKLYRLNVKKNNLDLGGVDFIGESDFYNATSHIDELFSLMISQ